MKGFEVNNLLIVESEGDKFFIEARSTYVNFVVKHMRRTVS